MIAALAVLVVATGCTTSTSSRYVKVVPSSDQTPEQQIADAQACDAVADAQYQAALGAWCQRSSNNPHLWSSKVPHPPSLRRA
jgi:hypothetical protein